MALTIYKGTLCYCRPGIQRDNCPACEGTGRAIDFAAIRAAKNLDAARNRAEVVGGKFPRS